MKTILEQLKKLQGLKIEVCGDWIWVSGDTKGNKDALKSLGLWWAGKKQMWYWKPEGTRRFFGKASMGQIRDKYGSEVLA